MGILSFLGLGKGPVKNALKRNAIIVDVRTPHEYDKGHIPEAFNIPADRIVSSLERLKAANLPVIVVCNSGARSSIAVQQLRASGIKEVHNGGNWENVLKIMAGM